MGEILSTINESSLSAIPTSEREIKEKEIESKRTEPVQHYLGKQGKKQKSFSAKLKRQEAIQNEMKIDPKTPPSLSRNNIVALFEIFTILNYILKDIRKTDAASVKRVKEETKKMIKERSDLSNLSSQDSNWYAKAGIGFMASLFVAACLPKGVQALPPDGVAFVNPRVWNDEQWNKFSEKLTGVIEMGSKSGDTRLQYLTTDKQGEMGFKDQTVEALKADQTDMQGGLDQIKQLMQEFSRLLIEAIGKQERLHTTTQ